MTDPTTLTDAELTGMLASAKLWQADLIAEQTRRAVAKSGVSIGDIVASKYFGECLVTAVLPMGFAVWLHGVSRRKDGAWGTRVHHLLSDWTLKESAP